jgi:hypothetical protein
VIRKALLLYLFIFTLEIVGYFISFKISGTFVLQNYHHFSQKRRVIKVRIGKPISVAEQNEYKNKSFILNS